MCTFTISYFCTLFRWWYNIYTTVMSIKIAKIHKMLIISDGIELVCKSTHLQFTEKWRQSKVNIETDKVTEDIRDFVCFYHISNFIFNIVAVCEQEFISFSEFEAVYSAVYRSGGHAVSNDENVCESFLRYVVFRAKSFYN